MVDFFLSSVAVTSKMIQNSVKKFSTVVVYVTCGLDSYKYSLEFVQIPYEWFLCDPTSIISCDFKYFQDKREEHKYDIISCG